MLCVEVAIRKCAGVAQTRAVKVIREKFIRPKVLDVEVQGWTHGSFYSKTSKRIVRDCECLLGWSGSFPKLFSDSTYTKYN